ncbi:DUF418 domain-containing protein [Leucobacter sp. UCMA 4100]|uniref:DUF418 domain-containing protein n=1 Tax=Leucobacter sp. UCMA 4100 TaxID=2810534 RepID=UPI0022EA6DDB|nr:DUF418 domain-containing protein [Leucobacter sp. UCMA 4100]MDA3147023.1 DUF418 domain-containing protein [Leucobacter sp. UCMA 4100]
MMLLFIALANVSGHVWGRELSSYSLHPAAEGGLDRALSAFALLFIDGHVYPMFAFLFGYGITQFAQSRIARNVSPNEVGSMLLRRHLWLFVFGAVHALLLFSGDILGAYALTGLIVAPLLLRGSEKTLRVLLIVSGSIIAGSMLLLAGVFTMVSLAAPGVFDVAQSGQLDVDAEILAGTTQGYGATMLVRLGVWLLATFFSVVSLIIPFAVLLGGYAARYRFLEGHTLRLTMQRVALWGIVIATVLSLPAALMHLGVLDLGTMGGTAVMLLAQLGGIGGGLGYVALCGVIGAKLQAKPLGHVTAAIAAVGKRSLSCYLWQSLIFAPLLAPWGFGLGSAVSTSDAFAIAILVWITSLIAAVVLERRQLRGPAEAILRRLTYGRVEKA